MDSADSQQPWFLQSSYPVLFPAHDALKKPQAEFEAFLREDLGRRHDQTSAAAQPADDDKVMAEPIEVTESETFTLVTDSTSAEIRQGLDEMKVDDEKESEEKKDEQKAECEPSHPFMDGLLNHGKEENTRNLEGMMHTENGDLAYRSTNSALVDLFAELEEVISGPRLSELLQAAWAADPLTTLKIIFNSRSIHLGKSSRNTFYRCAGWLAQNHPLTLAANLRWLSRPIIEKKAKKEGDDDLVIVDAEEDDDISKFDVQHGVSHGYWKDLLNILALAANDKLTVLANPRDVLNSENPGIIRGKSIKQNIRSRGGRARGAAVRGRGGARGAARGGARGGRGRGSDHREDERPPAKKQRVDPKEARHQTRDKRHERAVAAFETNGVYRALHLSIARLFAEQLESDLKALRGTDPKAKRNISLCGKWAPTHDHFHDKHTFIVSTISEILYPRDSLDELSPTADRATYLRFAREEYRKDTSALRKQLDVVERKLTTKTYSDIKYDRIPSLAMNNYSKLFIQNDMERFEKYIDKVAEGKAKISGATLLPSTLIHQVTGEYSSYDNFSESKKASMTPAQLVQAKISSMEAKVVDGQWKTLVQRIKDSGTLENCIAVCDVSGSMTYPQFADKTNPMEAAIGLSLLIAEVTKPPFGGSFITFSAEPAVVQIDLTKSLAEKYQEMNSADWGMNTNFVAVFERLILPIAVKNKLKPEDMVKRIFVFSDMQFDEAGCEDNFSTSYERIKSRFELAGYSMPELVFWNLAGGRAGVTGHGDATAPKPVTSEEDGTCLVSGYSQGMLKVFLDSGSFEEEEEEEEEEEVVVTKEGDEVKEEKPKKKKAKMNPMAVVRKAVSHKAYDMLKVVD